VIRFSLAIGAEDRMSPSLTCSIERTGACYFFFGLVSFQSSKGEKRRVSRRFPHFCLLVKVRSNWNILWRDPRLLFPSDEWIDSLQCLVEKHCLIVHSLIYDWYRAYLAHRDSAWKIENRATYTFLFHKNLSLSVEGTIDS